MEPVTFPNMACFNTTIVIYDLWKEKRPSMAVAVPAAAASQPGERCAPAGRRAGAPALPHASTADDAPNASSRSTGHRKPINGDAQWDDAQWNDAKRDDGRHQWHDVAPTGPKNGLVRRAQAAAARPPVQHPFHWASEWPSACQVCCPGSRCPMRRCSCILAQ